MNHSPRTGLFLVAMLFGTMAIVAAQTASSLPSAPAAPANASSLNGQAPPFPYSGSVPLGTASSTELHLSLHDAVKRGLKANLGILLSADAKSDARADRWRALSALLPHVTTETSLAVHQLEPRTTIGLRLPGVKSVVGPFDVFDTRAYWEQNAFNWEAIERTRASGEQVKASGFNYKDAHEAACTADLDLHPPHVHRRVPSRFVVFIRWVFKALTFSRGACLITGATTMDFHSNQEIAPPPATSR